MEHGEGARAAIDALRQELDRIDDDILDALARRFRMAARIGSVKAGHGVSPWEPGREAAIVRRAAAAARDAGIPEEGVREVYWTLLGRCREVVAAARSVTTPAGVGTP